MFFWLGILTGVIVAYLATKIGFYDILVHYINTLIAIYLALFLTPLVFQVASGAGDIPYSTLVTTLAVGIGSFLLLYAISYLLLIGQFKVSFTKRLDAVLGGFIGFLMGFLILSFIALLARTTTIAKVTEFLERNTIQSNVSYVCWWCDMIHDFVGNKDLEQSTQQAIQRLMVITHENDNNRTTLDNLQDPNDPCDMNTHLSTSAP